jgi:hypothetical protein
MKYYNLDNEYLKKLNQIASELKIFSDDPRYKVIPMGNNSQTSFQLFYQRLNYRVAFNELFSLAGTEPTSFKDTVFIHDLYGKINNKGAPIFVDREKTKDLSCNLNIKLLNFAADAYDDLFEKHKQLVDRGVISQNSKFGNIQPKVGWKSANDQHQSFIALYFLGFIRFLDANNINKDIINFKTFIKIFINFYNLENSNTLINKSQFIRSNLCTLYGNGLTVEFSEDDHANDMIKYNNYLRDPNCIPFNNLVKQYGFVMDKNYPWRLVFDINSQTAKKYLEKYEILNLEECFEKCYYLAEFYDYDTLIINLLNLYNFIVTEKSTIRKTKTKIKNNKICVSEQVITRKTIPENLTIEQSPGKIPDELNQHITEQELMEIFFYTKCVENNLVSTESEFQQYLSEINTINKYYNRAEAFEYINKICATRKNKGDLKFRRTFYSS